MTRALQVLAEAPKRLQIELAAQLQLQLASRMGGEADEVRRPMPFGFSIRYAFVFESERRRALSRGPVMCRLPQPGTSTYPTTRAILTTFDFTLTHPFSLHTTFALRFAAGTRQESAGCPHPSDRGARGWQQAV